MPAAYGAAAAQLKMPTVVRLLPIVCSHVTMPAVEMKEKAVQSTLLQMAVSRTVSSGEIPQTKAMKFIIMIQI